MVGVSVHEAERISCSDPNYFDAHSDQFILHINKRRRVREEVDR